MRRSIGPVLRFVTEDGLAYFQAPGQPTRKYKNPSREILDAAMRTTRVEAEERGWLPEKYRRRCTCKTRN